MGLTQKYKQQQQQVRVHTNESNYAKGMCFTDAPLTEGYSRVLINFDIDSMSGALTPRKGLQSVGSVTPDKDARLDALSKYNIIVASKLCAVPDVVDKRHTEDYLQIIVYNTSSRELGTVTCKKTNAGTYSYESFKVGTEKGVPEPFILAEPEIHGKPCITNAYFKNPVGTFAYTDSFYTFIIPRVAINKTYIELSSNLEYLPLQDSTYAKNVYYFVAGPDKGTVCYYTEKGERRIWWGDLNDLIQHGYADDPKDSQLCYTKLGMNIQPDETLLKTGVNTPNIDELDPQKYYICTLTPKELDPSEAASWGYNMLLKDPYTFTCKTTALNNVTILGIVPYGKDGKPLLTPKKGDMITLKGYYRAPTEYHSESENIQYYSTTQQKVTVKETDIVLKTQTTTGDGFERVMYTTDGTKYDVYYDYAQFTNTAEGTGYMSTEIVKTFFQLDENGKPVKVAKNTLKTEEKQKEVTRNPATLDELNAEITKVGLSNYNYGDWWCVETGDKKGYYIIAPQIIEDNGNKTIEKYLRKFDDTTQPKSVEGLAPYDSTAGDGALTDLHVVWEYRTAGAASWSPITNDETIVSTTTSPNWLQPFSVPFTISSEETLIRLTIYDPAREVQGIQGGPEKYVLSTMTIGLSSISEDSPASVNTNITPENYNLAQCTGMCEWGQRLVLWGVPNALNMLFISDVNNPAYFPYPNNVDILPDPIISVHNYGNELLVLTTSALYRLTWNADNTGWTHTLVQRNLHIAKEDTYIACVIKNMFFFKSGEQYYLMVPRASASTSVYGDVTVAPISKPIEQLLNNFHPTVDDLVNTIVNDPALKGFTDKLINYFSYTDNTKVVVNYVYDIGDSTNFKEKSKYIYVQLIYDTDLRTWTMRLFEAPHMLYASHADALQQDQFIDITPYDTIVPTLPTVAIQFYKFQEITDSMVQYYAYQTDKVPARRVPVQTVALCKNYQYLDTGNREINTELKKRFREFQFKLKNTNATNLGFYTSFLIDGSIRRDLQRYSPRYILDPNTNTNTIVIERELDPESMTYNTTNIERIIVPERMLQDAGELTPTVLSDDDAIDKWILDQSAFPGRTLWKVRMPITGKGYAPRAIFLSRNEALYELLGHSWVYRTMHAR